MLSVAFRSSRVVRLGVAGVVAAAAVLAPDTGAAQVAHKRFKFEERGGMLTATGGFREMFDRRLRQQLRSGFASTVVMRIYLYNSRGGAPIAATGYTLRAVYDLWDQRFQLRAEDARGKRSVSIKKVGRLVDVLTSLWRFPLVKIDRIERGKHYFVAVLTEVNPMQPEVLAEVRRWLRRPTRRHRRIGSESFFGSFVSIFVNNKIRRAEKIFKVRSQPFFRR